MRAPRRTQPLRFPIALLQNNEDNVNFSQEPVSTALAVRPSTSSELNSASVEARQQQKQDLATCTSLLKAGSKSFYAASLLLLGVARARSIVLYAFCRQVDDAVDEEVTMRAQKSAVTRLRERVRSIYAHEVQHKPVDRAFRAMVEDTSMPQAFPNALIEGMEWDANGFAPRTTSDIVAYSVRVAAVVGVMMTWLMGRREVNTLARACDLGIAMQLTNIARDIGEDARRGRVYLPQEWLYEEGLTNAEVFALAKEGGEETLAPSEKRRAVEKLCAKLLELAEVYYMRATSGIGALPMSCRVAIRAAQLIYREIGVRLARAGYNSLRVRTVVPTSRKMWLMLRSLPYAFARRGPDMALPAAPESAVLFVGLDAGPAESNVEARLFEKHA
jgi:15-cis-phytoene synthase